MVRPPFAIVTAGIAELRREPSDDGALVDEAHHGEPLHILARRDDWRFVQVHEDHYLGWVRADAIHEAGVAIGAPHVVARNLAPVFARPDPSAEVVDHVPAGASLVASRENDFVKAARGWVRVADVIGPQDMVVRVPTPDDVVAAARAFLGVPYSWGGTTARGLDCSGCAQLAYGLCGVLLARDAHQQATHGHEVAFDAARAADLVFFGRPRITHVGIALPGGRRMIHASGAAGRVIEEDIAAPGDVVSIRRLLP